jgi:hypothetical protein
MYGYVQIVHLSVFYYMKCKIIGLTANSETYLLDSV